MFLAFFYNNWLGKYEFYLYFSGRTKYLQRTATVSFNVGLRDDNSQEAHFIFLYRPISLFSQGLSLDAVFLDIGSNVFTPGMAYVALSRARSFDRVFLVDFDYTKLYCDEYAYKEYNKLRTSIKLPKLPICNRLPNVTQPQLPPTNLLIQSTHGTTAKKKKTSRRNAKSREKPTCTIRFLNIAGSNRDARGYVKCCLQLLMQVPIVHRCSNMVSSASRGDSRIAESCKE